MLATSISQPSVADRAGDRGEGHRDAEAEGDAEVGLRHREEALGEGIAGGEEQRAPEQPPDIALIGSARTKAPKDSTAASVSASRGDTAPAASGRSRVRSTWGRSRGRHSR
jgi:hypothetical protein